MKSYTILMLIFLTLVSVDSDAHSNSGKNNNNSNSSSIINSSSRFTKNTFSTNSHNFNTSLVGDSSSSATFRDKRENMFEIGPNSSSTHSSLRALKYSFLPLSNLRMRLRDFTSSPILLTFIQLLVKESDEFECDVDDVVVHDDHDNDDGR
ncbi:hypothetical protein CVS40_3672 [Lucilia cuprina]|nr:hypothetical protein CVS40_3672 [Lucilia cuprina]